MISVSTLYFSVIVFRITESDQEMAKILNTEYLENMEAEEKEEIKVKDPKRKFACGYCDFSALTPLGLKKHLKKVHPYPD